MTAPLAPGDWVECIRGAMGNIPPIVGWAGPTVGQIYQVVRVYPADWNTCPLCHPTSAGYIKLPQDNPNLDGGWCLAHFRPIYRPKAELIEGLLKVNVLDKAQAQSEEFFAGVCLTEPLPNGRWSPTGRWIAQ